MRKLKFIVKHFYHIFNRGTDKREIFPNRSYYSRFVSTLQHYLQFNYPYSSLLRQLEKAQTPAEEQDILTSLKTKQHKIPPVEVVSFCLMPNHFHLVLRQLVDQGISWLMHRLGIGFTEYFNIRQNRTGRLFETSFKARWIEKEGDLLHLHRYHHINPKSLGPKYQDIQKLVHYPWSSLSTYLGKLNKKPAQLDFPFVNPSPVLASFKGSKKYLGFIQAEIDEFEPIRLDKIAIDDDFGWFTRYRGLEQERRQKLIERFAQA